MENEEPKVILSYAKSDLDDSTYVIAFRQKWMTYAILLKTIFLIAVFFNSAYDATTHKFLLWAYLIVSVLAFFVTVSLSFMIFSSPVLGTIWGLISFVPVVGLILMFMINDSAVYTLKERGLTVGLFGANLSDARQLSALRMPDTSHPKG